METRLLITIEGQDGVGKTTVMKILKEMMDDKNYPTTFTREPGGVESSELIRNIVKGDYNLTKDTDLLLFTAARNEIVDKLIIPTINQGNICLTDRFILSTIVYQDNVSKTILLAKPMVDMFMKNEIEIYNYVLFASPDTIESRKKTKDDDLDARDKMNSFELGEKYKRAAVSLSGINNILFENMRLIDANGSAEETAKLIFDDLVNIIEEGDDINE